MLYLLNFTSYVQNSERTNLKFFLITCHFDEGGKSWNSCTKFCMKNVVLLKWKHAW